MSLQLHAAYSIEDAVNECEGTPEFWCDNQFAVLRDVVLCFMTVGKRNEESCLPNPSSVTWRPAGTDYAPSGKLSWLPKDVREVLDRTGPEIVQLRQHHMFVRPCDGDWFFYAGEAHLGSYGYEGPADNGIGHPVADFSLKEKLPRDLWLQCGGYSGWHIEVNHEEHLASQGDVASIDKLLGQLEALDYSQVCLTLHFRTSLCH